MRNKKVTNFICTFLVFAGIFICLALVTSTDIFSKAVRIDGNNISLFGTEFVLDSASLDTVDKVFCFNDNLFGAGFSKTAKDVALSAYDYACDLFCVFLTLSKTVVGA